MYYRGQCTKIIYIRFFLKNEEANFGKIKDKYESKHKY